MSQAPGVSESRYEYRGLVAEAWDLLRGDTSTWGDRPFYPLVIAEAGQPALDVGCGTGRLLLDYLARGLDVDGVDNSPEMLSLCREKASAAGLDVARRLFQQPMQRLHLPRRYRTIFVPSLSILTLAEEADADAAVRCFFEHLVPGGVLVMAMAASFWEEGARPPANQWTEWSLDGEAVRPDGAIVRRTTRERWDFERQLQDEQNVYELIRDGVVVERETHNWEPQLHWYDQGQARALLERAGFVDVRLTAVDTLDLAAPTDARFKIHGRRPS